MVPAGRPLDRLVLAERTVEQQLRGLGRPRAQKVEHHRVRGRELGVDGELAGDGRVVDVAEVDVTFLENDAVADGIDTAPPRAAHELSQLAAGERCKADTVELGEGRDDARAGRHVESGGEGLWG